MQLIKKYANRKLYHTNRKQYITLDGIGRLVQLGDTIQVLDNETGEDITASTLAQVVLQAQRHVGGTLPTNVLTGLIQAGGDTIASLRRAVVTSLGGVDLVEMEINRRVDVLEAQGALNSEEASRMRHLLIHASPRSNDPPALPTHADVDRLKAQVDDLARTVEQLLLARGK